MKLSTKTSTFHSTLSLSFCGKLSWIYGVSSTNKYLADFFKKPIHLNCYVCMMHILNLCAQILWSYLRKNIYLF